MEFKSRNLGITMAEHGLVDIRDIAGTKYVKRDFLRNKDKVDFYVFLTYLPVLGEHKVSSFQHKFVVVLSAELEKRMRVKDPARIIGVTYSPLSASVHEVLDKFAQ